MPEPPRIDITPHWRAVQDDLLRLVPLVPDDKINWSPRPELWNFRGIMLHIAATRDGWLEGTVADGVQTPSVWETVRTKPEIVAAYERTWERLQHFLADPAKLDAEYRDDLGDGNVARVSGHWVAFHLLEHDIHHRADLMHYLALLGHDSGVDL